MNPDQVMPWPNSPADTPNEIVGPNMHRESLENRKKVGERKLQFCFFYLFSSKPHLALWYSLSQRRQLKASRVKQGWMSKTTVTLVAL